MRFVVKKYQTVLQTRRKIFQNIYEPRLLQEDVLRKHLKNAYLDIYLISSHNGFQQCESLLDFIFKEFFNCITSNLSNKERVFY